MTTKNKAGRSPIDLSKALGVLLLEMNGSKSNEQDISTVDPIQIVMNVRTRGMP